MRTITDSMQAFALGADQAVISAAAATEAGCCEDWFGILGAEDEC